MAIGEVFLGAFLAVLLEKLASPHVREFAKRLKIRPRLEELDSRLSETQRLLDDAENKQIKSESVKIWLGDLRDWAYDAEDLLDEFDTKSMQREDVDTAGSSSIAGLVSKKVRALGSHLYVTDISSTYKSKLDEICARLDALYARKARLGLEVGVKNTWATSQRRPDDTSLVFHSNIYGRGDVEKQIIDFLGIGTGQGSSRASNLDVAAIVGMGGIGKTSLARQVFNNDRVQKHFELKGWVCVSSQFEVARATKAILEEFQVDIGGVTQLNGLQTKLREILTEKKFLLFLDDVWTDDYNDWNSLRAPFAAAARGSKVIVTTRHEAVASVMGTVKLFTLKGLSDVDCLSVFQQHAFDDDPSTSYRLFYPKILEKCKGLPLAARVLGGLLRGKQPNYWEATLNSQILELSEAEDGILSTLRLSYHHLSDPVKRCFSYCSVLPKNYEFEEEEIVLLWMAEGLIADQEKVDMEDLGGQYFRELLSRSLFQYANDEKSRFVMHDLVNDLARFVAGKSYVNLQDDLKKNSSFENARHVSFITSRGENLIFEKCENMKSLRAFLSFTKFGNCYGFPLNLLTKLRFLRALALQGYNNIRELPAEIGDLTLLRYIDLSHTEIERLPESICFICNLQTLKLKCCWRLMTLPVDMRKLNSLRHLDLSGCYSLQSMPVGLDELTCLRTISIRVSESKLMVDSSSGGSLPASLRKLEILKCDKLECVAARWPADSSPCLQELDIRECSSLARLTSQDMALPASLRKLNIWNCEKLEFVAARWPGDSSPCLQELDIRECSSLARLTSEDMALPASLTKLDIRTCKKLKFVAASWPADSSSSLQELGISYCSSLRRLASKDMALPASLRKLEILKCEKLKFVAASWPAHSSCLQELEICGCPSLTKLTSDDMALPVSLRKLEIWNCKKLEFVAASWPADSSSLQELWISYCSSLRRLASEDMALPASLRKLGIRNCEKLEFLAASWPADSSCLQELEITDCPCLTKLTSDDMALPASLTKLEIGNCEKLEFVAARWPGDSSPCLQELEITDCPCLTKLTSDDMALPASLTKLEIRNCEKLEFVAARWPGDSSPCLQELDIRECSSLARLTSVDMALPASPRKLNIWNCEKLEFVAASWPADSSFCLQELDVRECSSLRRLTSEDMELPVSLTKLNIRNCENLEFVAARWPADSSPSLQELDIRKCSSLTRLTSEDMALPASLTKLDIRTCTKLEILAASWPADSSPCLQELWIRTCSSLRRLISVDMALSASLRKLNICNCEKLEFLAARWPADSSSCLQEVWIRKCPSLRRLISVDMALPASLRKLTIWNCDKLEFVAARWPVDSFPCLQELDIRECSSLTRLTSDDMALPASLRKLTIWNCDKLEFVAARWPADSSPCLQELWIRTCSSLRRLISVDMALSASLRKLNICNCEKLEFLAARWPADSSSCLQELWVSDCSSLRRLISVDMALPASLRKLTIWNCDKLEFVAARWPVDSFPCLQELDISECSSLTRLTSDDMALPASLRKLEICSCDKLEILAASWPVDSSRLQELWIGGCSSLTRLISVDMALPASLTKLDIRICKNLEFLAESWPADSSCLQEVWIRKCPSLRRLISVDMVPPASLRKLVIEKCKNLEFVAARWPGDTSPCLQELEIQNCPSFTRLTSEDMALPASLRKLKIWNCGKLEFVAASWQADSSCCLQELDVRECSSLTRLTSEDMELPASLRKLEIRNCEKLEFLAASWPVDSSLRVLEVCDCSSLTRLTSRDMALPASLMTLKIPNTLLASGTVDSSSS